MKFIEITDEEALNLSADQLMAITVYNQLCSELISGSSCSKVAFRQS